MKGIYENDSKIKAVIHEKLAHYPPIMTQYFNWLMDTEKTINTAYVYIKALTHYIDCEFPDVVPHDFYEQIDESSITRFLNSLDTSCDLQKGEPSNSYKAVKWSALNSFFQYLTPTFVNDNPVENIVRPMVGKVKKSEYLTVNEVTALLNKAQQLNREKICSRDLSIMMLGFYCGLRVSAIVQANTRDINWVRKELRVYKKKDEFYDVPLSKSVMEQLRIWLIDRKQILGTVESDALFVSLQGNRINEDTISLLLKTYSVEIDKNINARMMRDTCIINLYLKTRDLALCAKLLNQTNIASVYRYIEKFIPMSNVQNAVQVLDNLYGFKPGSSNGSKNNTVKAFRKTDNLIEVGSMALVMYLTKAPRYQNILTNEYETIPLDDLALIDKYFFWSMRRAEGKTDAYTLKEWCGIPESKLPHKYVINYYRDFFTEKRFYKEHSGNVTGFSIFTQVTRIVKANQVFRWFVENVMNGKTDKDYHEVTKEQLEKLASDCRSIQETIVQTSNDDSEDARFAVNENVAKLHLPLMDNPGLFFGTNQYGTVYATDIIRTLRAVERILRTTDFEKEVIYFNAMW